MGFLRVLLVIVIMFSGYVSAAHGITLAAAIDCCDQPQDSGCDDEGCGGCLVQAAVVTPANTAPVFSKPALQPLPVRGLARDALSFHLRPPDAVA